MRLLMTADAVGGVWQYATELAAALAPHGIETVLALMGPSVERLDPPAGVRLIDTGLPLDWLADGPEAVAAAGRAVATLADEIGADAIQLNSPALAADTRFPCPVVAVAHGCIATWWEAARGGALPTDLAWHFEAMRRGLAAVDAVVAPSAAYATTLRRRYGLARMPLAIHNGRSSPGKVGTAAAGHVLTVGRLWDEAKNVALLDRVAARLSVPLRAVGTAVGPQGQTVATAHLDRLGTLGEPALRDELARRPIFVSAATFEPFGLAVLEAAQAGCALVLADIPTFRELWEGAAIFVPPADETGWVDAIEHLLAAPAERAVLSDAARHRAGRYTPAATATAMARLYGGLAEARRVAA